MSWESWRTPRARGALAILKLLVVPVAVGWVVMSVLQRSPTITLSLHLGWLVPAMIAIEVALWLVSLRLVQLLAIYGAPLGSLAALRLNLRSMFYFLVVPTQAGMEAVRFVGLRSSAPKASAAAVTTTLVLDRVLGALAAGILFAATAVLVVPQVVRPLSPRLDGTLMIGAALLLTATVVAGLVAHRILRRSQLVMTVLEPLRTSWRQLVIILGYAVLAQVLVVACVACALRGLAIAVPLPVLTFGIMGGTFLMLIPISFAGLGAAELGGAALLILAGVAEPTAITAVFVTYLTRVFAGLQGAAIELWNGGVTLQSMVARPRPPQI